jgi:hypothetical protein
MRRILAFLALWLLALTQPALAEVISVRSWTDADGTVWTETVEEVTEEPGSERFVAAPAVDVPAIAAFGPFRVIDPARAALVGETDSLSPSDFQAMLRAYPGIAVLELVDCPGTLDDTANLRLGRMIRARGLATHVPADGSVRSGAVELFLAGAVRSAEPSAEFAVHSWLDTEGREAGDFAADDPVNRTYLAYYREMGLTPDNAAAFYALTNSVPNETALWLRPADIARYAALN